jgi:osmotically-inducible protein OsmY
MSAVKTDIETALKRRAKKDAQKISVEVRGSTVTLTGNVHSWSEHDLATHSAWGTPGVKSVIDHITIGG